MKKYAVGAVLALLVAACGGTSTTTAAPGTTGAPGTTSATGGPSEELIAAAQAEGVVTTIALPLDWCGYEGVIAGFEAKYTVDENGLDRGAGSAEELEAIDANKDNPGPAAPDVVDIGLAFGPQAKADGLIQPYKVATWDEIPESAKDADGYWYGDYYGVLAFEVNKAEVATSPADWADLLKPDYNGQVALSGDPLTSNAAILSVWAAGISTAPEAASLEEQVQAGLDFFKQLNDAGNFVPIDGDSRTVGIGETPILVDYNYNSKANAIALAGNPEIDTVVPASGLMAGMYTQAISAYAPHPNAAKLWEEYLYSDEGQLKYAEGFCYPIRFNSMLEAGTIPDEVVAELPSTEGAVFPTLAELEQAVDLVVAGWPSVVGVTVDTSPTG